jgi:hypothetical protein
MRCLLAFVVVVLGACSGGQAYRASAPSVPTTAASATQPASGGPDARATPDPVAAAVRYVATTDGLMAHSSIGRREILRSLVTPGALVEQVEGIESAVAALAEELGVAAERLTWVEAPISATTVTRSDAAASVDVWVVSVLGSPDTGPPQQAWRTVHVNLVLLDGKWLVSGANADAGPTPLASDLALPAGWDEFSEVAGWTAMVEGEWLR